MDDLYRILKDTEKIKYMLSETLNEKNPNVTSNFYPLCVSGPTSVSYPTCVSYNIPKILRLKQNSYDIKFNEYNDKQKITNNIRTLNVIEMCLISLNASNR